MITLIHGDCLEEMKKIPDNSVDSIVTDPPYGLSFMGKKWDIDVPSVEVWQEAIRVLKPGGHLISFGGTRTYHRMAVAIEDAGFEIRDMVSWCYASGFPKSLNIGKAVDKLQGNEREEYLAPIAKPDSDCWGIPNNKSNGSYEESSYNTNAQNVNVGGGMRKHTKGNSPWEGWGTALKPAQEPCVLARKPLSEKTVAENVLKWGTGGLNIDGSRVGLAEGDDTKRATNGHKTSYIGGHIEKNYGIENQGNRDLGRFPANLIHDGSDEVLEVFPSNVQGEIGRAGRKSAGNYEASNYKVGVVTQTGVKDSGSAARFFYSAKVSKRERTSNGTVNNGHPTIKPIALMEYMIKLITPPNGTVLDPFMGSGSTGIAAKNLGHSFIGIEREEEYIQIAEKRIEVVTPPLY